MYYYMFVFRFNRRKEISKLIFNYFPSIKDFHLVVEFRWNASECVQRSGGTKKERKKESVKREP